VPRDVSRVVLVGAIVGSMVIYGAIAASQRRWVSTVAAAVVAVLLACSHRRARFAAYIFFSALAVRGTVTGVWALPLYGGIVLAAMQTAAARRAWPRLARGRLLRGRW
jgi:hypothetical protein